MASNRLIGKLADPEGLAVAPLESAIFLRRDQHRASRPLRVTTTGSVNAASWYLPRLAEEPIKRLTWRPNGIRLTDVIRGGFLSAIDRQALLGIAQDGLEEHRIARRANAIVLLDLCWSCERVAAALLLDDDTVRKWHRAFEQDGVEGLKIFGYEGSSSRLSAEQEAALSDWISSELPRSTRAVDAWLRRTFGLSYSRGGLIAMLHRLGFDYRKPERMPRGLNDARQPAFIDEYENPLNTTHHVRPAGCWAPKGVAIAVE